MPSGRASNTRAAAPLGPEVSLAEEFHAFDSLPQSLRAMLRELTFCASATQIERAIRHMWSQGAPMPAIIAFIGQHIHQAEARELDDYSHMHQRRYGVPTPHVVARATIQRYGATDPVRASRCS